MDRDEWRSQNEELRWSVRFFWKDQYSFEATLIRILPTHDDGVWVALLLNCRCISTSGHRSMNLRLIYRRCILYSVYVCRRCVFGSCFHWWTICPRPPPSQAKQHHVPYNHSMYAHGMIVWFREYKATSTVQSGRRSNCVYLLQCQTNCRMMMKKTGNWQRITTFFGIINPHDDAKKSDELSEECLTSTPSCQAVFPWRLQADGDFSWGGRGWTEVELPMLLHRRTPPSTQHAVFLDNFSS